MMKPLAHLPNLKPKNISEIDEFNHTYAHDMFITCRKYHTQPTMVTQSVWDFIDFSPEQRKAIEKHPYYSEMTQKASDLFFQHYRGNEHPHDKPQKDIHIKIYELLALYDQQVLEDNMKNKNLKTENNSSKIYL